MATRTFAANKSSLFAKTGSTELGGGQDDHLPVGGSWNGYTFRSAVRFATDWSGMKNIQSAVLWLKTSSAVHLAFSSDPDVLIARATADWTANSSSSSSEGGSGWSTAATNYPGPSLTTTGQVSKDVSTAEQTWVSVDITSIVRAWAPASVVGGGGAGNYGVVLYGAATGDLTEFGSYHSTVAPYIVVTYTTDTAPVTTATGPTGVQATTRPTITATATDVDGDPIDLWYCQVVQGSTVVYDSGGLPGGPSLAHVPTVDLPGGALFALIKCQAGGLWSNDGRVDFTVDRPPTVTAWSAPAGNVSSNRRPVHTFTAADPDGDALELYDLEVYQSAGGVPSGGAVYAVVNQSAGISGMSVSHTPTVDLPGGPLLARSRVRTGPADLWSAWSAYQPYTIVLTVPTVAWVHPATDGAYLPTANGMDLANYVESQAFYAQVDARPPAGQTLTHLKIEWQYTGGGFFTINDTGAIDGAGGIFTAYRSADNEGNASWGSGRVRYTLTASGGGVTVAERAWKASALEWFGAVYLGDQVSALAATMVGVGGQPGVDYAAWARAQSSATAAVAGAAWLPPSDPAILAKLPATGAWLGLRSRFVHRLADVDLLGGLGHWDGPNPLSQWNVSGQVYVQGVLESKPPPTGGGQLRITGDGVTAYPQATKVVEVIGGALYRLNAYLMSAGLMAEIDCRVDALNLVTGQNVGFAARLLVNAGGQTTWTVGTQVFTMPPWATHCQILLYIAAAPSIAGQDVRADAVELIGPAAGVSGLDRWDLAWTSLG